MINEMKDVMRDMMKLSWYLSHPWRWVTVVLKQDKIYFNPRSLKRDYVEWSVLLEQISIEGKRNVVAPYPYGEVHNTRYAAFDIFTRLTDEELLNWEHTEAVYDYKKFGYAHDED